MSVDNALDRAGRMLHGWGLEGPLRRLYPPYHLHYFTPPTLEALLHKAYFAVVEKSQENYSPQKASASRLMRLALRGLYRWHDWSGKKTNQYLCCLKRPTLARSG